MAPVPNLIYQSLIAVPIILMYQLAILIVWYEHRPGSYSSINKLAREDSLRQQQRQQQAQSGVRVLANGIVGPAPDLNITQIDIDDSQNSAMTNIEVNRYSMG